MRAERLVMLCSMMCCDIHLVSIFAVPEQALKLSSPLICLRVTVKDSDSPMCCGVLLLCVGLS